MKKNVPASSLQSLFYHTVVQGVQGDIKKWKNNHLVWRKIDSNCYIFFEGEQQLWMRWWRQVCHQEQGRIKPTTISLCWRKNNSCFCSKWTKVSWVHNLHRSHNFNKLQGEMKQLNYLNYFSDIWWLRVFGCLTIIFGDLEALCTQAAFRMPTRVLSKFHAKWSQLSNTFTLNANASVQQLLNTFFQ